MPPAWAIPLDVSSLSLRGIEKSFGATPVVRDLSLEVARGELFFILGPSGCGKSTLLRIVAGLEKPERGSVYLDDRCIDHVPPQQRGIGMVFQNYALWPHLTVWQNISFGLEVRKLPRGEVAQRVQSALELVRLSSFAQRYPHEISGGQQQRVALARALAIEPHIILLDEPLSNLDARLREEIRSELAALHARLGITMVYVTHDQDDALILADRVALLNQGSIEQIGTPRALYESPRTIFAAQFFGAANLIPCRFLRMSSDTTMVVALPTSPGLAKSADAAHLREITVRCAPVSPAASPQHPPATVTVCVRPEAIQFDSASLAPACGGQVERLQARVRRSTYHGAWCDLLVETELGIPLTVRTATGSAAPIPHSGDRITVGWQPQSAVVVQGA